MTYNVAIVGIDDPKTFKSNLGMMTGNEYMVPFNESSIHIHPDWNENQVRVINPYAVGMGSWV